MTNSQNIEISTPQEMAQEIIGAESKKVVFMDYLQQLPPGTFAYSAEGIDVSDSEIINLCERFMQGEATDIEGYIKHDVPNRSQIVSTLIALRDQLQRVGVPKSTETRQAINDVEDAEIISFASCQNLVDIERTFDNTHGLLTSNGDIYTKDHLLTGIERARNTGFSDFLGITRTEGLREQVAKVMLNEVQSFTQLIELLKNIESITGSEGQEYSQEYLLNIVAKWQNNMITPEDRTTRAFGFYDTIQRCLANQR